LVWGLEAVFMEVENEKAGKGSLKKAQASFIRVLKFLGILGNKKLWCVPFVHAVWPNYSVVVLLRPKLLCLLFCHSFPPGYSK
jgi:hypothetical protein